MNIMRYMLILKYQTFEEFQKTMEEKIILKIPAHQVTCIDSGKNRIFIRYKQFDCLHYLDFKRSEVYIIFRDIYDETELTLGRKGQEFNYYASVQKIKELQEYIGKLENALKERCGESWAKPDFK